MSKNNVLITRNGEKYKYKSYVDGNGFHVLDFTSPTVQMTIKRSNSWATYINNGKVVYDGTYNPNEQEKVWEEMNQEFNLTKQKWDEEFRIAQEQWDKEMKEFSETINKEMNFDPLSVSFSKTFDSGFQDSKNTSYSVTSKSNGCCLTTIVGCIFWLLILCLIIYGMGIFGGEIVEFFKNLF